ncbi:hypothetical protein D3C86_1539630 [compost metagenome]
MGSPSLGGMMPGVSISSRSLPMRIQDTARVTPGLSPVLARPVRVRRLMSELLPTFGRPTTMIRAGRGRRPRALTLACTTALSLAISCLSWEIPSPLSEFMAIAGCPWLRRSLIQAWVRAGSARSVLVKTTIEGLPLMSSVVWPKRLLAGIRASTSSSTKSMIWSFSLSSRWALAMCPGNH